MPNEKTTKVEIYRLMYRLNRSFAFTVEHLRELELLRMVPAKDMKMFQASVQEVQAEINDMVLDNQQLNEQEDAYQFDRIRVAREKELRDPGDIILRAEELKRELKGKGKKNRPPKS